MPEPTAGQPAGGNQTAAAPTEVISTTPAAAPTTTGIPLPENKASEGAVLSDDALSYIKSQNLDLAKLGVNASSPVEVNAFIAGHKAVRATKSQENQKSTATPEGIMGNAQPPVDNAPTQGSQQTAVPPTDVRGPSQMDIINMKTYLENTHKDVEPSKLGTQEFYDGMRAYGFNPVSSNGEFNVSAIARYADIIAKDEKIAKLEEAVKTKPTSTIPDVNDRVLPVDETVPKVNAMTEQAALNIVLASRQAQRAGKPVHPQLREAEDFIKHAAK